MGVCASAGFVKVPGREILPENKGMAGEQVGGHDSVQVCKASLGHCGSRQTTKRRLWLGFPLQSVTGTGAQERRCGRKGWGRGKPPS
jgi:hypothetical protein